MVLAFTILTDLGCASAGECTGGADATARDLCRYERAVALDDPAVAYAELDRIEDPIVRSAGVFSWLKDHPKVDGAASGRLCALTTPTEKPACERRVVSAHLHR